MTTSRKRCAVYTRKSTEDGLDQDFNSLDAQGESCRAYILSQAGEGWTALDTAFDDGGISGGHMDRPGLQALIADIEAGLIDIVVVYKVDRLTRSLSDFAKLVEVFDRHGVSFVSVTQAFNTTTSIGRLTLNVLLSFAQFEREVTAERIRDKIAASKKRGQWMGGLPPLGYDNVDKKLVTNDAEAKTVRHIMARYIALRSVRKLKDELDREGYVTKRRQTKKENQVGGKPFSRGHLYKLLSNPVYIGKVRHKGEVYDGQHEPIVDQDLWVAVQSTLEDNAPKRRRSINITSNSLLTGLLFDETDQRLTPVYSRKPNGRRYRYYISPSLAKGKADDGAALRLPAEQIEGHVIDRLTDLLSDTPRVINLIDVQDLTPQQVTTIEDRASMIRERLTSGSPNQQRSALINLIDRIHVSPSQLTLKARRSGLVQDHPPLEATEQIARNQTDDIITLNYPLRMKRRGVETKLVIGGKTLSEPDPELIKLIAMARSWYAGLKSGEYDSQLAIRTQYKLDKADVSRILNLAFLSPTIVGKIIAGDHPADMTVKSLKLSAAKLHLNWEDQVRFLGMSS